MIHLDNEAKILLDLSEEIHDEMDDEYGLDYLIYRFYDTLSDVQNIKESWFHRTFNIDPTLTMLNGNKMETLTKTELIERHEHSAERLRKYVERHDVDSIDVTEMTREERRNLLIS